MHRIMLQVHPNPRIPEYDFELLGVSTGADWPPSKEFRLFEKAKYPWSKVVQFVDPYLSAGRGWPAQLVLIIISRCGKLTGGRKGHRMVK